MLSASLLLAELFSRPAITGRSMVVWSVAALALASATVGSRPGYLASAGLLLPAASHPYLGRSTLDCWHVFTLPELDRDWRAWDWFRTRRRRYGRLTVLTAMTPPIRISALRPNSSQREDR